MASGYCPRFGTSQYYRDMLVCRSPEFVKYFFEKDRLIAETSTSPYLTCGRSIALADNETTTRPNEFQFTAKLIYSQS